MNGKKKKRRGSVLARGGDLDACNAVSNLLAVDISGSTAQRELQMSRRCCVWRLFRREFGSQGNYGSTDRAVKGYKVTTTSITLESFPETTSSRGDYNVFYMDGAVARTQPHEHRSSRSQPRIAQSESLLPQRFRQQQESFATAMAGYSVPITFCDFCRLRD